MKDTRTTCRCCNVMSRQAESTVRCRHASQTVSASRPLEAIAVHSVSLEVPILGHSGWGSLSLQASGFTFFCGPFSSSCVLGSQTDRRPSLTVTSRLLHKGRPCDWTGKGNALERSNKLCYACFGRGPSCLSCLRFRRSANLSEKAANYLDLPDSFTGEALDSSLWCHCSMSGVKEQ